MAIVRVFEYHDDIDDHVGYAKADAKGEREVGDRPNFPPKSRDLLLDSAETASSRVDRGVGIGVGIGVRPVEKYCRQASAGDVGQHHGDW